MALLADGLHMASHAAALMISVVAYVYARRHAADVRYSFGTGKVNAIGGYTCAVLLALFALVMAGESVERLLNPVSIAFNQAIWVALVGLLVNAASVFILGGRGHSHGDDEDRLHHGHHDHGHEHGGAHVRGVDPREEDHNLRSAYLHVIADALTSLAAIAALLTGRYLGWGWMDPAMGIVGPLLVARWAWGLARDTGCVLLDRQAPGPVLDAVTRAVEGGPGQDRVADLHVWAIGPALYAGALSVVSETPQRPDEYRRRLASAGLAHATVEVHNCEHDQTDR